jgi:hypothetical protein
VEEGQTKATHNLYFAEFAKLTQSVEDALVILAAQTEETICLMDVYTKRLVDPPAAGPLSNSFT